MTILNKFVLSFFLITAVSAQPKFTNNVSAELISEVETIKSGEDFWVGIKLQHKPGWHTYWRNAGDAGLPTRIEWHLPEGFKAGEISWPYPEKILLVDVANFGYENPTMLLTKISASDNLKPGSSITLKASVSWLACKVECVPEFADLSLTLKVSETSNDINPKLRNDFEQARNKIPYKDEGWKFSAIRKNAKIILTAKSSGEKTSTVGRVTFFPYEGGIFSNASAQKFSLIKNGFTLEIQLDRMKIKDPDEIFGVLVSKDGWGGKNSLKALEVKTVIK